jgi:hypothetical protein
MENKNGAEMVAVAAAAVFFLAGHSVGGSSSVCLCVQQQATFWCVLCVMCGLLILSLLWVLCNHPSLSIYPPCVCVCALVSMCDATSVFFSRENGVEGYEKLLKKWQRWE